MREYRIVQLPNGYYRIQATRTDVSIPRWYYIEGAFDMLIEAKEEIERQKRIEASEHTDDNFTVVG